MKVLVNWKSREKDKSIFDGKWQALKLALRLVKPYDTDIGTFISDYSASHRSPDYVYQN